ncbi:hypothetical protein WMY93_028622 [Mugilogobius chulae]|uniref:Rab-GAP TBC domain-containing protein n=1 Tax=Mugilogobius chulae TaxID=88201 RepID=A0AAW0MVJ9_9GOBI
MQMLLSHSLAGKIRNKCLGNHCTWSEKMDNGKTEPLSFNITDDRTDLYGFERPHDFETYKDMMDAYATVLSRRSQRWSKLLQERPHVEKNMTVKRFVRKGVPNEHRARIWMAASGAREKQESNIGYYQSLLEAEHDTKLKETIYTDMHRTFPDNILFKTKADSCLQKALFNILVAYGHHNKAVGYCQGMNFIADISF